MYFCPCCGYRVLYEQPPGTYLVCPICFWEDVGDTWELRRSQLNFISFGACNLQWLSQVRCPTEQDERDPNWQLLDEKIKVDGAQIIQEVITAFNDVKLEDGISLQEANEIFLIEDLAYPAVSINGSEAEALLVKANATDINTDWQKISEESLNKAIDSYVMSFYYLDPRGWRYYLPAYMVWSLRKYIDSNWGRFDDVVRHFLVREQHKVLDRTQQKFHRQPWSEYLALLTAEQLTAICQFLWFIINYSAGWGREEAIEAMEQRWQYLCSD